MNIPQRSLRPWIRPAAGAVLATVVFTATILLVRERMGSQPLATGLILYTGFALTIVCVGVGAAPHLEAQPDADGADAAD